MRTAIPVDVTADDHPTQLIVYRLSTYKYKDMAGTIKSDMEECLKRENLTPARASTLRGKVGSAILICEGRYGKAKTVELAKRQYKKIEDNSINTDLKRELNWWVENLVSLPKRKVPMAFEKNNVAYSDASGGKGIAIGTAIIAHDEKSEMTPAYSGTPPSWLVDKNIYILEIYAVVLAAFHVHSRGVKGPTLFFLDNDAALSALIRGFAEDYTARLLISIFWRECRLYKITPWLERVCSANNIADGPSRRPISECRGLSDGKFTVPSHLCSESSAITYASLG